MPIKVAVVGAGSIGFTRSQVRDILCIPELQDTEFALTDINERNLDMVFHADVQLGGFAAVQSTHRQATRFGRQWELRAGGFSLAGCRLWRFPPRREVRPRPPPSRLRTP